MNLQHSDSFLGGAEPFGLRLSLPRTRRDAMRLGLFSLGGLMTGCRSKNEPGAATGGGEQASAMDAGGPRVLTGAKAKSVIQDFLWGGMSHNDTWDPKPDAGYDYNGAMRTFLNTNVPGIQLSGWFPRLAQQADKYSLIRSMTHRINGHETAAYMVQTAHAPGERLAYPSVGAFPRRAFWGRVSNLLRPAAIPMRSVSRWRAWFRSRFPTSGSSPVATC